MVEKLSKTVTVRICSAILFLAVVVTLSSCSSDSSTGPASTPANEVGSLTLLSDRDTDGDGVRDLDDSDDDNDGIPDETDADDDNDSILDDDEPDTDEDGIIDDHDDDFAELKGKISSMGQNSFVAFGYTVIVDGNTALRGDDEQPIDFGDLAVGMLVEVHGVLVSDDTILARDVEVEDGLGDDIPFDSLQVGDYVQVKGLANGSGGWLIREIHSELRQAEFEYDGPIETVAATALEMLGVSFAVNASTRFEDETDMGKSYDDLEAGDFVDVRALYDPLSQTFIAKRVRLSKTAETFATVEAEVFAIDTDAGTVVVGGVTFMK